MRRKSALVALLLFAACSVDEGPLVERPDKAPSPERGVTRVLALGDFGTGDEFEQRVADAMCRHLRDEPFTNVVTTGDNIYPFGDPRDFEEKFIEPFQCLFEEGVRFHASLGNHDAYTGGGQPEIDEPAFGMPDSYYTWKRGPFIFVVLDSNELDEEQLSWMRSALDDARSSPWTVVVFHHPVYAGGIRHGPTEGYDELLAPAFTARGVDLVLNGHDHIYSRAVVDGVTYIVTGGGGATVDVCRIPKPAVLDKCISTLHFVELEATREGLTTTAIADSGEVFDVVRVARNE